MKADVARPDNATKFGFFDCVGRLAWKGSLNPNEQKWLEWYFTFELQPYGTEYVPLD